MKKTKKDLKKEVRQYKKLAYIDDLTQLYNRRKLNIDMDRLIYEKERYKARFSLVMIDINGFKKINDKEGHLFGDDILKKLARELKKYIRKSDRIYRYGGDEFIILLPHTTVKNCKKLARRVKEKIGIPISFGVAKGIKNKKEILSLSDKQLYNMKRKEGK